MVKFWSIFRNFEYKIDHISKNKNKKIAFFHRFQNTAHLFVPKRQLTRNNPSISMCVSEIIGKLIRKYAAFKF